MLDNPLDAFIEASVWHGSLEPAQAILAAHPELASCCIQTAAILGDDAAIGRFLALDSGNATAKGGPRGWDALTYLCFSKYLRLDRARSAGFVRAATALLDAGADPNAGFYDTNHRPEPEFESALYGAAGVAHHEDLTRLLVERGADPNDGEVAYHTPESYDNGALKALVECGKLTGDSLATMLLRKHDWHDCAGIQWLLEHGADPNRMTHWRRASLHQAIQRDNSFAIFEVLLDHGADPTLVADGRSAIAMAARRGRGDLLELFERRGVPVELRGIERLLAACARNDAETIGTITAREPHLVGEVLAEGGKLLAEFAGNGRRPLLGRSEGEHSPARRSLARSPRDCEAPHRTPRAGGRSGRQGPYASGSRRARLRRLILERQALARIGGGAAECGSGGQWRRFSIRLRGSG